MRLIDLIKKADQEKIALGHFNFCNFEILKGIALASKEMNIPVLVGISEGERSYLGRESARNLVRSVAMETGAELYLSADHTKTLEEAKKVIDLGYDTIVADGSSLSFDENIKFTKAVVLYALEKNQDIVVEGEIGVIGQSSEILDSLPDDLSKLTDPSEAKTFIDESGISVFSPALGNIHGLLRNQANPNLDISRIKSIKEKTGVFLTLHGASGVKEDDIHQAVKSGINIVHFNSDLRVAYKDALKEAVLKPEIAPYKYLDLVVLKVKEVVKLKLNLLINNK